jgi:hypothetical protein
MSLHRLPHPVSLAIAAAISVVIDPRWLQPAAITVTLGPIISAAEPKTDHVEPWLAVDPTNPRRAVAIAIAGSGSAAYATSDGGASWTRAHRSEPESPWFPGIDPVVVFDTEGTGYLATISPFRVWRSRNGGLSWQGPAEVPGRSYDREFLAVRPAAGAPDTVYAVGRIGMTVFGHRIDGGIGVARSVDGGRGFEYPRLFLLDPARSIIHTAGGVAVTGDGKVVISVMAHDVPVLDAKLLNNHIWVLRSDDGGRSFADPVAVGTSVVHGNAGSALAVAKDVSTASLAMDTATASPLRGRVYLAWLSIHEGRGQVLVATSADTGRTWTAPVRVNDDAGRSNHSNPVIAANGGVAVVLWNDRRADPNDLCFRATVSASVDGGATFLPNVPLVERQTCPLGTARAESFSGETFRERYLGGGETQGLAPLPGGNFLAAFVDQVDSALQLRAARIRVSGGRTRP